MSGTGKSIPEGQSPSAEPVVGAHARGPSAVIIEDCPDGFMDVALMIGENICLQQADALIVMSQHQTADLLAALSTPAPAPTGEVVTLAECPIGLFWCGDTLALKTEYQNNDGRINAYIVETGEAFHGPAPQTTASQRATLVQAINTDAARTILSQGAEQ